MGDVLRLVRAHNLLIAAAGVLAGGWIALREVATSASLGWAGLAALGFGAAGYALNDLCDTPADRMNRPAAERPLAAGRMGRGTAELCIFVGVLVGVVAAALVSGRALLLGLGALGVMIVYSPILKRRGLPGNAAVALVAGLPPFYGALAVGRPAEGVVPWVLAGWAHLARELVKDLEDEAGDRALGRRTLPILLGRHRAAGVAAGVALGFVPASLMLPYWAHYGGAYFVIALPAQLAILLAATRLFLGRTHRTSVLLKGAMLVGLGALVAGRVA